jgi:hypothetical protein
MWALFQVRTIHLGVKRNWGRRYKIGKGVVVKEEKGWHHQLRSRVEVVWAIKGKEVVVKDENVWCHQLRNGAEVVWAKIEKGSGGEGGRRGGTTNK